MAEENEETTRGPKEVTTKDPRRVQQGKNLQEHNHGRKELEAQNQFVIRVVLAVGAIGGLGYYLNQAKKVEVNNIVLSQQPSYPRHQTNKFEIL